MQTRKSVDFFREDFFFFQEEFFQKEFFREEVFQEERVWILELYIKIILKSVS